jgi:hypothetical protein
MIREKKGQIHSIKNLKARAVAGDLQAATTAVVAMLISPNPHKITVTVTKATITSPVLGRLTLPAIVNNKVKATTTIMQQIMKRARLITNPHSIIVP